MDTKEAIESLEESKLSKARWNEFVDDYESNRIGDNKMGKIVALLRRGEKFEAMWKKLKRDNKEVTFYDEMEDIEQKHFPKGERKCQ